MGKRRKKKQNYIGEKKTEWMLTNLGHNLKVVNAIEITFVDVYVIAITVSFSLLKMHKKGWH